MHLSPQERQVDSQLNPSPWQTTTHAIPALEMSAVLRSSCGNRDIWSNSEPLLGWRSEISPTPIGPSSSISAGTRGSLSVQEAQTVCLCGCYASDVASGDKG